MVGRRAELTYKANLGRHAWLRLTPAYSVRVVERELDRHECERVLDPFSGTGTTALCAASRGIDAVGTDINPFLIWLGRTKTRRFAPRTLRAAESRARELLERLEETPPAETPPIHRIERWWSPPVLDFLRRLRAAIRNDDAAGSLLEVAFCRTVVSLSAAAFDHVSMSFGEAREHATDVCVARFRDDVAKVLEGAAIVPRTSARFVRTDARALHRVEGRFDRVITSPPYPNRMSYVRELRPYMYWTGHLNAAREAGELDWRAIGGTWGIATSRLAKWERTHGQTPSGLAPLLRRIEASHTKNGPLLARYVDRYFEDTQRHLEALRPLVAKGARLSYVIGNASFYGVAIPADRCYAELFERAGFRDTDVEVLRKRNSKKELFEYVVRARA